MGSDAGLQQPLDPSVAQACTQLGQAVCVALNPPSLHPPPPTLLPAEPRSSLCKVDRILLGLHEPLSGENQEWNSAAPAQTGGVLHSQAVRQTDSFNRKGNCLSNCRELMSVRPRGHPEAPVNAES